MSKLLMIVAVALSAASCSTLKKQCENTNWFNHGKNVAMRGQRLDEDDFVKQCRKVEADISHADLDLGFKKGMGDYCLPDTAYETGRKGEKFSRDLCDGTPGLREMIERHKQGVVQYCQKENGYSAGAKGIKYNHICPPNLEKEFLPEFHKGRKHYLTEVVNQKQSEIEQLNTEVRDLEKQRGSLNVQLANLNRGDHTSVKIGSVRIVKNKKRASSKNTEDPLAAERADLTSRIRSVDHQIAAKRRQQTQLQNEISETRKEMIGL